MALTVGASSSEAAADLEPQLGKRSDASRERARRFLLDRLD